MRGLASTIALLLVLIGLGAYIHFVTNKRSGEDTGPKKEKVFAGVEPDKIEELKVKSESGDVTSLKKVSGTWQIVAPVSAPAAESEIIGLTSALGQMEIVMVIDENPTDLKEYGLANPRIEVEFKSGEGKPSGRILVGDKTPTGANLYAKRNDEKRVFLIADFQDSSLNKSTFNLRDKTLIKIARDKVDGVEVDVSGKPIQFAKDGSDWKITKPIAARADFSSVEGLVGKIETAQMKSIVTEQASPADLKTYGLDKPDATITINEGSARAVVEVGGKAAEDAVYARDASKGSVVVTLDKSVADDLKKSADDYRRKDVFEFRAFNATRVEFTRGSQTITLERVKGQGKDAQDSWRRVSPNPADADKSKVESLL